MVEEFVPFVGWVLVPHAPFRRRRKPNAPWPARMEEALRTNPLAKQRTVPIPPRLHAYL